MKDIEVSAVVKPPCWSTFAFSFWTTVGVSAIMYGLFWMIVTFSVASTVSMVVRSHES